jgi:alpha-soluble NSF attachment protein
MSEGSEYEKKAFESLQKNTFFGFLNQNKYQDAYEYFKKAGIQYIIEQNWYQAYRSFREAGDICLDHLKNRYEALKMYSEMSKCLERIDETGAIEVIKKKMIELYIEDGRYYDAGKYEKELGDRYEKIEEYQNAIEEYQLAIEYFKLNHKKMNYPLYLECLIKIGLLSARLYKYSQSIHFFEKVLRIYHKYHYTKSDIKEFYFRILLCMLAMGDIHLIKKKVEEIQEFDKDSKYQFEYNLIHDLMNAIERNDAIEFAQICSDYDKVHPFQEWTTYVLLNIKLNIKDDRINYHSDELELM